MSARRSAAALLSAALAAVMLAGCSGQFLERSYSSVQEHTSRYWESDAANTLRASNRQDVVNDLLLLISQHSSDAIIRLYNETSDLSAAETMERAAAEVQQDTPLGAWALEYITSSVTAQRSYYEVSVSLSYRRTLEQQQRIINATNVDAFYRLLTDTVTAGGSDLAVRLGHWSETDLARLETYAGLVRAEFDVPDEQLWLASCYPETGSAGIVEVLLAPTEEELAAARGVIELAEAQGTAARQLILPAAREESLPESAVPFESLLGFSGYYYEEPAGELWHLRTYVGEREDGRFPLAESFGFGEARDSERDLDGDGIAELICSCAYGGDGVEEVFIYRNIDGVIFRGAIDLTQLELPGWNDYGAGSVGSWYDADAEQFVIRYESEDGSRELSAPDDRFFIYSPYTGS